MTWRPSPPSAPGCGGSSRPPVSSPWTGARRLWSTTKQASPPAHNRSRSLLTFARARRQELTIAGITLTSAAFLPFFDDWPPQCCRRSFATFSLSRVIRPRYKDLGHDKGTRHSRLRKPPCAHRFFPTARCHRHLARDRHAIALPHGHPDGAVDQGHRRDAHSVTAAAF